VQKKWGILGGGFGLYGYMPALSEMTNLPIVMLERHMEGAKDRPELRRYLSRIEGVKTVEELLKISESLVISVPPKNQQEIILKSNFKKYKNVILEKPLGTSPGLSKKVLEKACSHADAMRIGYTFSNTKWADYIERVKISNEIIDIEWTFTAFHLSAGNDSWKATHEEGGGVLRFYGIQLIALLSKWGVSYVESSIISLKYGESTAWVAIFHNEIGGRIHVKLDCFSPISKFIIKTMTSESQDFVHLESPFCGERTEYDRDERVGILKKIIESLERSNESYYESYANVNKLWDVIEKNTVWQIS